MMMFPKPYMFLHSIVPVIFIASLSTIFILYFIPFKPGDKDINTIIINGPVTCTNMKNSKLICIMVDKDKKSGAWSTENPVLGEENILVDNPIVDVENLTVVTENPVAEEIIVSLTNTKSRENIRVEVRNYVGRKNNSKFVNFLNYSRNFVFGVINGFRS